jgi:hypothetical protein
VVDRRALLVGIQADTDPERLVQQVGEIILLDRENPVYEWIPPEQWGGVRLGEPRNFGTRVLPVEWRQDGGRAEDIADRRELHDQDLCPDRGILATTITEPAILLVKGAWHASPIISAVSVDVHRFSIFSVLSYRWQHSPDQAIMRTSPLILRLRVDAAGKL